MKCEACAKREATVAYTHIVDDVKKTQFVCSVCAGEKAPDAPARPKSQAQDVPELVKETKVELPNIEGSDEVGGLACRLGIYKEADFTLTVQADVMALLLSNLFKAHIREKFFQHIKAACIFYKFKSVSL